MSFSTFSGPVRVGTVRDGLVSTGRNTGLLILSQTAAVSATTSNAIVTSTPTPQNLFVLPAGSKILRFTIEKPVAIAGGSVTDVGVTLGSAATAANSLMTSVNIATTLGTVARATIDAAQVLSTNTTIGAGSNNAVLPQATINVASTTGLPTSGIVTIFTSTGYTNVAYTGTTGTTLTGCTGGTGTLATSSAVIGFGMNYIGNSDVTIRGTFTAAGGNPTSGLIVVGVEYVQRLDDGSANPLSA